MDVASGLDNFAMLPQAMATIERMSPDERECLLWNAILALVSTLVDESEKWALEEKSDTSGTED